MCKNSKNIKFCTCNEEPIKFREMDSFKIFKGKMINVSEKTNNAIPLVYVWHLYKYKGTKEIEIEGELILPENEIGNCLNSEWIAFNLNHENCFDFEYTPNEGDNLKISQNVYNSPYLSFIFKKNEWVNEHYSTFTYELELINSGKLMQY